MAGTETEEKTQVEELVSPDENFSDFQATGDSLSPIDGENSPESSSSPQLPDSQSVNPIVDEARSYGFSDELINSLPPEQLDQVMNEFASKFNSSPNGMIGQQQPYQQAYQQPMQQPPPQQPVQHQQQQQQQQQFQDPSRPDWDNEDLYDPDYAKGMKYLDSRIEQLMQQQFQQQQQEVMNEYLEAIDGLQSDVISRKNLDRPEIAQHATLYEQFRGNGMDSSTAARLALRSLGISSKEELLDQAKDRSGQVAGKPLRSANGQFTSALGKMKEKLRDMGQNPEGAGDDFEGFLD